MVEPHISHEPTAANADSARTSPLRPWGIFIALLLLVYAVVRASIGHEGRLTGQEHPAVGHPLIFASLRSIGDPEQVVGLPDLTGHVTLVNFWGTWCPPCRTELPQLAVLAHRFEDRDDFKLLAVSCEPPGYEQSTSDLVAETKAFLKQMQLDLPVYFDPEAQTRAALDLTIGFEGFPTTLVVDRQGTIRGAWIGYRRGYETQMDRLIDELLNSKPPTSADESPAT